MLINVVLLVLLVIVLLVPYRWTRERTFGGLTGSWQSALYTYTYGPGYECLEFVGLRRLQFWLLLIITTVAGRLQPEVIARLVEAISLALGL